MRRSRLVVAAVLGVLAAWAAVSLAELGPLDEPLPAERAEGWLLGFAVPGIVLYVFAAARFWALYRDRPAGLLLGLVAAFVLLAEALVAIAFARSWHATWWEWHLLMLAAFALVAVTARREWREERFADLYLRGTADAEREISVLFADLEGFTTFSETSERDEVAKVVNAYVQAATPLATGEGGEVEKVIGDSVMVTFNKKGDCPDHAVRAVRAGLAIQAAARQLAAEHSEWPRLRVGVNSGLARVGIVGGEGKREHTVLGDAVNLASRLEGKAQAGQVVVGADTYARLPDGTSAEPLGNVQVKGKGAPVAAYVVVALPEGATSAAR